MGNKVSPIKSHEMDTHEALSVGTVAGGGTETGAAGAGAGLQKSRNDALNILK